MFKILLCFHLMNNLFAVQCIRTVTKMCVKMEALVCSISLSTHVNVLQCTAGLSVRMVSILAYLHICITVHVAAVFFTFPTYVL